MKWNESIQLLIARGVERFIEVGPGKVLMRPDAPDRPFEEACSNVEDEASLQKTVEYLKSAPANS